ncbi:MAG TPA: nuclear transport factor 2 family protein [Candidatus Kryptonia bacterium]
MRNYFLTSPSSDRLVAVTVTVMTILFTTLVPHAMCQDSKRPVECAGDSDFKNLLIGLEKHSWQMEKEKNGDYFDSAMTDDFIAVEADGRTYTKAEVVPLIPQGESFDYELTEFKIIMISEAAAIVSYNASVVFESDSTKGKAIFLASSVWTKVRNKWLLKFHQKTAISS